MRRTLSNVGTPTRNQSWQIDATSNFTSVTSDGTPVSRTHDKQNELLTVGAATLTYDGNGNMTTDETGKQFVYDAWNRLVQVNR